MVATNEGATVDAAIDTLPLELLQRIFGETAEDTTFCKLESIALVCRRWYRAVKPLIHSKIDINVFGRELLIEEIERWTDILSSASSFDSVRVLELRGQMPEESLDPGLLLSDWKLRAYGERLSVCGPTDYAWEQYLQDKETDEMTIDLDRAWYPLEDFISLLPGLSRIIFACKNQFPPCLLKAIHQREHPRCKISIRYFRFRSLKLKAIPHHESQLLTSPCLDSISIKLRRNPIAYSHRALWRLLSGVAPNLKHLKIFWPGPFARQLHYSEVDPPSFSPDSGFNGIPAVHKPSALESLTIVGYSVITEDDIENLDKSTDLASLGSLEFIGSGSSGTGFAFRQQAIARLMQCNLQSLTSFSMKLMQGAQEHPDISRDETTLHDFLEKQLSLHSLKLEGGFERPYFSAALSYHSPALRKLYLLPHLRSSHFAINRRFNLGYSEILDLDVSCPLLEELAISLPRTRGDEQEVSLYATLGSFSHLRRLILALSAQGPSITQDDNGLYFIPGSESFDSFDQRICNSFEINPDRNHRHCARPRYGHIRDAFVNSALDEKLARSIFAVLLSARSDSMAFLETLEVFVDGAFSFGGFNSSIKYPDGRRLVKLKTDESGNLLDALRVVFQRYYKLSRIPASGNSEPVLVTQLTNGRKVEDFKPFPLPPDIEEVYERLWPSWTGEGNKRWYSSWYSFPLQV